MPSTSTATNQNGHEIHRTIDALNQQAYALRRSDPLKGTQIAGEAYMIARGSVYERGVAWSILNDGLLAITSGNLDRAAEALGGALVTFERLRQKEDRAIALAHLGLGIVMLGAERHVDALSEFDHALRRARRGEERAIEAEAMLCLGRVRLARAEDAAADINAALELARTVGDTGVQAECLLALAEIEISAGRRAEAMLALNSAVDFARSHNARGTECQGLVATAELYYELGDNAEALAIYHRAVTIATELGASRGLIDAYAGISAVHRRRDELQKSLEYATRRIEVARLIGSRRHIASALNGIGNLYFRLGDCPRAIAHYTECLDLAIELDRPDIEELCLENLGNAYRDLGEHEQALSHYTRSRRLSSRLGHRSATMSCYFNLGVLAIDRRDYTTAIQHLNTVVIGAEQINDRRLFGDAHYELAHAYEARGSSGDARRALEHIRCWSSVHDEVVRAEHRREIDAAEANAAILRSRIETLQAELYATEDAGETRKNVAKKKVRSSGNAARDAKDATVPVATATHVANVVPIKNVDSQPVYSGDEQEFVERIHRHFSRLSPGELRVCALMYRGLQTREMASLLGVTDRAVEKHRYKMRRKLLIPRATDLLEYLKQGSVEKKREAA